MVDNKRQLRSKKAIQYVVAQMTPRSMAMRVPGGAPLGLGYDWDAMLDKHLVVSQAERLDVDEDRHK